MLLVLYHYAFAEAASFTRIVSHICYCYYNIKRIYLIPHTFCVCGVFLSVRFISFGVYKKSVSVFVCTVDHMLLEIGIRPESNKMCDIWKR